MMLPRTGPMHGVHPAANVIPNNSERLYPGFGDSFGFSVYSRFMKPRLITPSRCNPMNTRIAPPISRMYRALSITV